MRKSIFLLAVLGSCVACVAPTTMIPESTLAADQDLDRASVAVQDEEILARLMVVALSEDKSSLLLVQEGPAMRIHLNQYAFRLVQRIVLEISAESLPLESFEGEVARMLGSAMRGHLVTTMGVVEGALDHPMVEADLSIDRFPSDQRQAMIRHSSRRF